MQKSENNAQKSTNSSIAQALHYLAHEMADDDPLRFILYFVAGTLQQRCR